VRGPDGRRRAPDAAGDPDEADERPCTADVLGPLPVWALTGVLGAVVGERAAHAGVGALALVLVGAAGLVALGAAVGGRARAAPARWHEGERMEGAASWHHPGPWPRGAAAVLAVLTIVGAAAGLRVDTLSQGLLPALASHGGDATIEARVVEEPRPVADGWHVDLRVERVDGMVTRERAATTLADAPPGLGERWRLQATARPPPDGGYGRWLTRRHVRALLDTVTRERIGDPGVLARSSERVRERIRTAATARTPESVGGLLVGFVIGDTRLLPDRDAAAMRATSLTHLTAVSGSHTALVVAGVLALCTLVRLGARGRRRTVLVTICAFAYLTRFEPSVLRAGTMALLVVLTFARGVPRDARHALSGAVLLLVLIDPLLAGSLGLLLSAVATAGVLVVAPQVRERLTGMRWLPRRVADLLAITLGAQVAVVPLLLSTFGEVGLASVPANLLAVPAGAAAAGLGFVGAVVALLHVDAASAVFELAGGPARVVLAVAHGLADVGGVVETARPLGVAALLSGCAWLGARPRTRTAGVLATITVLGVVAASVPGIVGRPAPSTLQITAIDVGQGDAFLVESPAARLLVDAGEDAAAGRWLRSQGGPALDVAVVTHPHLDHVGGMAEVLRSVEVGALWYRPMPNHLDAVEEMLATAADVGVPVRAPVAGQGTVVGDLEIEVLGPPPGRPYRFSGSELNDSSIVLRVTWEDRRVLLTGDAELAAQADLLETPHLLRAEAFTVPHHGGATTDPAFLEAVGAQVGLIGVGEDNRHGHPHPEVLAELERLRVEVARTDRDGTVTVEVPGPAGGGVTRPRYAPGHGARPPARRRRRPAVAAGDRARPRGAPRAGPGAAGRDPRRHGDRASARDADRVAVRRPDLCAAAWGRGRLGGAEGRAGELPRRPLRRCGAGAGRAGSRTDPEDRQARQGARRAARGEEAGRLGPARLGPPGRRGVPSAGPQGRRLGHRGDPVARRLRGGRDRLQGRAGLLVGARRRRADRGARRAGRRGARPAVGVRHRRRRGRAGRGRGADRAAGRARER
jgi:competence protein ComEC